MSTTTTKPARVLVRRAVLQALHDELESDPDVIVMGEDIAVAGGPFKCTEGLLETFGPRRVLDTPISEMGFLGAAVGAAATGLKPVVEMMFIEFIGVALDQLTTEATRLRYLSRGQVTVPLVVRASAGAGLGFGCQHSQMLDYWFRGVGGLKVCVVSNAQNAYGLLRSAIRDPDPVVVLEPRALYGERQELVTGEDGIVPLGEARTVSPGDDVTIVAAGAMVGVAEEAAVADDWHVVRGDRPADAGPLGQAGCRRVRRPDGAPGRRRRRAMDGRLEQRRRRPRVG